ncbi:MAG: hypothetical protein BM565_06840 [Gammaproteobacteria bacterium MedPE]|nr:MAG: hypothetical protein BM565_06840 [Gammaproteobacteria bacterium MedPE]
MKPLASLILLGLCFFTVAAQELTPAKIQFSLPQHPQYNSVLFHYYKQDYQAALKALSIISVTDLSTHDQKTHQLLENLLQVSNGNKAYVGKLVADSEASIRAILGLVNEHIEFGQWQEAKLLLTEIADDVPKSLSSEYLYLQGLTLLNSQKDTTEIDISLQSDVGALWLQQLSNGLHSQAELNVLLKKVSSLDSRFQIVKDHALKELGYQFLQINNNQHAIQSFSAISIDSAVDTSALLGLGLALNSVGQFDKSRVALTRVLQAKDPGILSYEALLAHAYALEQQGDEVAAVAQLKQGIKRAQQRLVNQPQLIDNLKLQSDCFATLLAYPQIGLCDYYDEDKSETFVEFLTNESNVRANEQYQLLITLNMDYNKQLQTIAAFNFLLNHQIKQISELLNSEAIESLERRIDDTTLQRAAIVASVDDAEENRNGHFFLSDHYLALQRRIDDTFARMVFLKRAGQKNTASERRVTLMQRIVWWHSFSNFSKHLAQTRDAITDLNNQLTDNHLAYQILQDFLAKIPVLEQQLALMVTISTDIANQQLEISKIQQVVIENIGKSIEQFYKKEGVQLSRFIVDAKLALVRINDASFNRHFVKEQQGLNENDE